MNTKERQRERFLSQAFGLTPAEWDKVFDYQRGVCFVCGKPSKDRRLATDHRHFDGLFRGLLCAKCNPLLGKIENSFQRYGLHKVPGVTLIGLLERFAAYLRHPPAVIALQREIHGYAGRIGTKRYRKWVKDKQKKAKT